MRAAFDLDGTLVHHGGQAPLYDDPLWLLEHSRPHEAAVERVRGLLQAGAEVHVITGRGRHARLVTLATLGELFGTFPPERLHVSPHDKGQFPGYDGLRARKASVLNEIQPDFYVGDHDEADAGAAHDAGVPFLGAAEFQAGAELPAQPMPLLGVM